MQILELERSTTQMIGSKSGAQNRPHSIGKFYCLVAAAILLVGWKVLAVQAVEAGIISFLDNVRSKVCMYDPEQTKQIEGLLGNARFIDVNAREMRGGSMVRHRLEFMLPRGDRLHLNWLRSGGQLFQFSAELRVWSNDKLRPGGLVLAGSDCAPIQARHVVYTDEGRADRIEIIGSDLTTRLGAEPVDPFLPDGVDPGGVTVALIDSGVAYDLPVIGARLARDETGRILGYDYWDMDAYPYDLDTAASPFFPRRHGTTVASLLIEEAPHVRLIPYRYPRPDMDRFSDLIEAADKAGASIVAMPMGSRDPDDWNAFLSVASQREHMLFVVSAGNNGWDIDREPVYPASFDLENMLVVTSAEDDGQLAPGSNWGVNSVDVMVPAERLMAINHLGGTIMVSGASYAVPRIAALAARLKSANPDWSATEVRSAILARAVQASADKTYTRFGWIPEPGTDR
jgi:subtilisin family serine protease